ncbi:MAG: hypothetical protein JW807_02740 [Spirochaetes bacterium]|nr:hypothetical protein [Spirochaetota bacterium]
MSLFVLMYVWQNIEVVKIEMEHRSLSGKANRLIMNKDRLLYEIERYRRMAAVEDHAWKYGMRQMSLRDFDVIVVNKRDAQ